MESSRIQTGERDTIYVYALDSSGSGVDGAIVTLTIRRQSDGYNWTGEGYTSTYTELTMSELDASNFPGVYYYQFTPEGPSATFLLNAKTTDASVSNGPWLGEIKAGSWADNIDATVSSRGAATDITEILRRLGTSIVELDMRRIYGFCGQILAAIREKRK